MYHELYQYLILNRELQLPGIGRFQVERESAGVDFASRQVSAPIYCIALHHGGSGVPRKVYQWLASCFRINEQEAVIRFNDFAFELRNNILAGNKLVWNGIGTLSRGLAGEIRFESAGLRQLTRPIPASKVLRENAEHVVRVGEQERTSAEMIELLQPAEQRKNWSWVAIAAILVAAVIFIGYYFSEHGVLPTSTGNRNLVNPALSTDTYRNIP